MILDKEIFAERLTQWYQAHKRDLPWRHTKDPYQIWLSEIILQQTRVKQGLPYFEKFIQAYPTVEKFAITPIDEVLRLWQGLGYYSRARNMYGTAQLIHIQLGNKFPNTYQELLKLKGIGKYTAAAIASFAFDEKVAVVDGNVYRVLARLFGIATDINSSKGQKEFGQIAQALISDKNPGIYNQAIMEFGALQCTPAKPDCMFCPFQKECVAFNTGQQDKLPVKINKVKIKERYFHYLVFEFEGQLALKKRTEKDIWEGLYDFCLLERETFDTIENVIELNNYELINESKTYKHVLTHQKVHAKFWHILLKSKENLEMYDFAENAGFFSLDAVQNLPKPILIDKYLKEKFF